jgi:hypothetical protein
MNPHDKVAHHLPRIFNKTHYDMIIESWARDLYSILYTFKISCVIQTTTMQLASTLNDAPPNFLINSTTNPNVKIMKR